MAQAFLAQGRRLCPQDSCPAMALAAPFRSLARPSAGVAIARPFSSVPINKVARVWRFHVPGEAEAVKMDTIVKESKAELAQFAGYEKSVRTVCKAEWAYEVSHVFDSYDHFKAFMDSPKRQELSAKYMESMKPLIKDVDAIYMGNRVHDEI
uniref:ABM domain-containing protein n=1 Tax=Alexandrium monilatum TaxID=311494 RepID=A0A7S4T1Y6_9DINO